MCFEGVPARPYISGGGCRVTWKVLAEYSWSPSTTRPGSFLVLQYSGSYKRVKVHPWAIPYPRTFYACEQSRCPGSDKLFFPKDFKTQKIFLVFLWKGKSARKIPACRKQFWKISNMLWRNQMRCKENLKRRKSKYEINTNLPLARARRFKSDVHDFSPPFLPLVLSA